MTISQALGEGVQTAVIGLSTVFAVLIVLMIVISIMKAIFYKAPEKRKVISDAADALAKAVDELPAVEEEPQDEEELIAVITAAIAASLNTSTYHLHIRSLRRIDNKQPEWNRAGIQETINHTF